MLKAGREEIEAISKIIESGAVFRYRAGGVCETFERRLAAFLGARHVALCSSGTTALTAALAGLGIGPGDEVLVPAHTYMATAIAVLAVGAIPVIVDVDESIMISPDAVENAIGPRTRAVIPVHMWGLLCDMDRLLEIGRRRNLLLIEDACQCIGGTHRGRAAGAMGQAGAFSFNFYKNMSCGEGGAVITSDDTVARRARCMIDPCSFYWEGREDDFRPFAYPGARASELQGAMLGPQLDRLPGQLAELRRTKARVLKAIADLDMLTPAPNHSPEGECAIRIMLQLPDAAAADRFAEALGPRSCVVLSRTGRHNYTEWDPILTRQGAHHPAMNPFNFPQNAGCRMDYRKDLCPKSLEILARTVAVYLFPYQTDAQIESLIASIRAAAAAARK